MIRSVSTRTFRVTVRGAFTNLDVAQRDELLAHAAEHDILRAAFTADGHVTYDIATRPFFTCRFEATGDTAGDIGPAATRAEARARAWLTERGYGFKNLAAQAEDLSDMPLGKRERHAAASP